MNTGDDGIVVNAKNVTLKLVGYDEVGDMAPVARCSHDRAGAWGDPATMSTSLAEVGDKTSQCYGLYDDKSTWGASLISKVDQL